MAHKFKIGDKVTATCDMGDMHRGVVVAYIAGTAVNGEREYWCEMRGFGQTIWPESALVLQGNNNGTH